LGLGPLIRPDLLVFSVGFVALHLVLSTGGWRPRLGGTAIAAALPGAYELFRMAYFANLVPNPALAKEASEADWDHGIRYAVNLARPYWLLVPLTLLLAWALTTTATRHWH